MSRVLRQSRKEFRSVWTAHRWWFFAATVLVSIASQAVTRRVWPIPPDVTHQIAVSMVAGLVITPLGTWIICLLRSFPSLEAEERKKREIAEAENESLKAKTHAENRRPRLTLRCLQNTREAGNFIVWVRCTGSVDALNVRVSDLVLPLRKEVAEEKAVNQRTFSDRIPDVLSDDPITRYIVRFTPIQTLVGDEVILDYDIEGKGNIERKTGLYRALLESARSDEWGSLRLPFSVEFSNLDGDVWISRYELTMDEFGVKAFLEHKSTTLRAQ